MLSVGTNLFTLAERGGGFHLHNLGSAYCKPEKGVHVMKCEPPIYILPGDVTGQFTAAPPTCPGRNITFRCTVNGSGTTLWRVGGSSNLCTLLHGVNDTVSTCMPNGASRPFTAMPESGFGPGSSGPFTSTLSATTDPVLDGTLVECYGPDGTLNLESRVGSSSIETIGQ